MKTTNFYYLGIAGLLLVFSLESRGQHPSESTTQWRACKTIDDCVAVRGCCGWAPANKKFAKKVEQAQMISCPMIECTWPPEDFKKVPALKCELNQCEINRVAK